MYAAAEEVTNQREWLVIPQKPKMAVCLWLEDVVKQLRKDEKHSQYVSVSHLQVCEQRFEW